MYSSQGKYKLYLPKGKCQSKNSTNRKPEIQHNRVKKCRRLLDSRESNPVSDRQGYSSPVISYTSLLHCAVLHIPSLIFSNSQSVDTVFGQPNQFSPCFLLQHQLNPSPGNLTKFQSECLMICTDYSILTCMSVSQKKRSMSLPLDIKCIDC